VDEPGALVDQRDARVDHPGGGSKPQEKRESMERKKSIDKAVREIQCKLG